METMAGVPAGRSRRGRLWWAVAVPAAVLLLAAGSWLALRPGPGGGGGAPSPSPLIGRSAPALAGPTLDGGRLDLAALRGHVVLVTVWAAWCAPCQAELPVLVDAGRRLAGRGVRLVGIDHRDGERQARELLARTGGDPAASVVDPDGRVAEAWHVQGVPQTFVVDAAGTVRASRLGAVTRQWIDAAVGPLLAAGHR